MADEPPRYRIARFDPQTHDRAGFSCGIDRLDNFLKLTAKKQQTGDFTRVFVATAPDGAAVLGYYAVNAHSLLGDALPEAITRRAPPHGVPAAYLSMIAVSAAHQGRGLGRILLVDALKRLAAVSDDLGLKAVVLDVLEDGGADAFERRLAFYERMGFRSFPSRRGRMFLLLRDAMGLS